MAYWVDVNIPIRNGFIEVREIDWDKVFYHDTRDDEWYCLDESRHNISKTSPRHDPRGIRFSKDNDEDENLVTFVDEYVNGNRVTHESVGRYTMAYYNPDRTLKLWYSVQENVNPIGLASLISPIMLFYLGFNPDLSSKELNQVLADNGLKDYLHASVHNTGREIIFSQRNEFLVPSAAVLMNVYGIVRRLKELRLIQIRNLPTAALRDVMRTCRFDEMDALWYVLTHSKRVYSTIHMRCELH